MFAATTAAFAKRCSTTTTRRRTSHPSWDWRRVSRKCAINNHHRMRFRLPCASLFIVLASITMVRAQSGEISGPLSFVRQPFDVLHYDVDVDLTRAPARDMSGLCRITLRWRDDSAGSPYFAFHLRSLSVDSVWYNGERVFFATVGDSTSATFHYRIVPSATPEQGETSIVTIAYHGRMTDELGPSSWGGVGSA